MWFSLLILSIHFSIFKVNGSGATCSNDDKWTCVKWEDKGGTTRNSWACCNDDSYPYTSCEDRGATELKDMSQRKVHFCGWVTGTQWGWTKTDTFGKCKSDTLCLRKAPKPPKGGYPKGFKITHLKCGEAQYKRGQRKKGSQIFVKTKITGGKEGPTEGLQFMKPAVLKVDGKLIPPANRRMIIDDKIHFVTSKIDESEPWVHGYALPPEYQNIEDLAYVLQIEPPTIHDKPHYKTFEQDFKTLTEELKEAPKMTKEYEGTALQVAEGSWTFFGKVNKYKYIALPLGGKMVDIRDILTDGTKIEIKGSVYVPSKTAGAAQLTLAKGTENAIVVYKAGNNVAAKQGYFNDEYDEYDEYEYENGNGYAMGYGMFMLLDVFTIITVVICMVGCFCVGLFFGGFAFCGYEKLRKVKANNDVVV